MLRMFGIPTPRIISSQREALGSRIEDMRRTATILRERSRTYTWEVTREVARDVADQFDANVAQLTRRLKRIQFWWG